MKRFRDLPHRSSNEALRVETGLTVKLSETGAFIDLNNVHADGVLSACKI